MSDIHLQELRAKAVAAINSGHVAAFQEGTVTTSFDGIHLHFHFPLDPRIDQILTAVHQIQTTDQQIQTTEQGIGAQMATAEEVLANLQAAASQSADTQQSVILLLNQLHAEAVAAINSGNLDAFQAVADALNNGSSTLAAAVVADADPNAAPPATTPPVDTGTGAGVGETGTPPPDGGGLDTGTVTGGTPPDTGNPPAAV